VHNLYDTIRKVILFFTISYINRNESVFLISYLKVFIIMFSIFHDIFTMFALKLPCCVFLISADENKSIVKWKHYIAKFFFLFISSQKPSVFEHNRKIRSLIIFVFSEGKLLQRRVNTSDASLARYYNWKSWRCSVLERLDQWSCLRRCKCYIIKEFNFPCTTPLRRNTCNCN
jgi:hypothetical protein